MRLFRTLCCVFAVTCLLTIANPMASAQEVEVVAAEAVVAPAPTLTIDTGDTAWMMASAALVLMMTGPGLALFYGGLVRRKNVLSTMMHSFVLMAVVSVLWALVGYSLAFAPGSDGFMGRIIGGFQFAFLNGVGAEPNGDYAATIPHSTWMIFQLMFAIITPALISGAYAERMKFSAMLVFSVLWLFVVYIPMAHMVWGVGGMFNWLAGPAEGFKVPALDFAGGTVVHISSGVSALVCALVLGKRQGFGKVPMPPHSVVLSVIGAAMLWVGWFGFNAGSALGSNGLASNAFITTHFAAAAATLAWMFVEWLKSGKPTVLGAISGAVAGLVVITPAAGFVTPMAALIMGAIGGIVCFLGATVVKHAFGYDDSLDAFGVHGLGGTIGAILTGVFASSAVNSAIVKTGEGGFNYAGLLEGNAPQLMNQIIATVITWVFAGVASFILLKLIDVTIGLRVTVPDEQEGLDITQHGESGYNLEDAYSATYAEGGAELVR